jgi:hypothetical protein
MMECRAPFGLHLGEAGSPIPLCGYCPIHGCGSLRAPGDLPHREGGAGRRLGDDQDRDTSTAVRENLWFAGQGYHNLLLTGIAIVVGSGFAMWRVKVSQSRREVSHDTASAGASVARAVMVLGLGLVVVGVAFLI